MGASQTQSLSGRSWVATVVSTIWTRFFELWDARNKIVHGVNINDYTAIQKATLLDKIKDLHSRRNSFHRSDLPFLIAQNDDDNHKLDEFVETNYVSTIRTWLRMWTPTFVDGAKLASAQAVSGMSRIYDHFPVLHRVVHNRDPIRRGRQRSRTRPTRQKRVDLSRFHRVTTFFSRAVDVPDTSGTPLPIAQIDQPH
jgi:hypothetical protein